MENTHIVSSESPFLSINSFGQGEPKKELEASTSDATTKQSPFQSIYEMEGLDPVEANPDQELASLLMDELQDEEFESATETLILEARELYEGFLQQGSALGMEQEAMAFQLLEDHFTPLEKEVDRLMDQMISLGDRYDQQEIEGEAYELQLDQLLPEAEFSSPHMEYFFKKLWRKAKSFGKKVWKGVKKGVKKGISFVKKLGLGFILRRLKGVVKKFLRRIIGKVIKKLPASLRPHARKLARKIPGVKRELWEGEFEEEADDQLELNLVLTEMLLAENEFEFEAATQLGNQLDAGEETDRSMEILDQARENFIRQINELEEGENPEPVVEEFVTAILTALRWGIRLIGRKRVKRFFVKIIAKLIRKLIGRRYSKPLSRRIVDYGFKALRLELQEENEADFASEAVAATIEDTLHEMAEVEDFVLEDETLLEGQLIQAFEHAAAANLPDILSETQYQEYPDLRESFHQPTMWKWKNIGKRGRKKYRYKKHSKVYKVNLSPQLAKKLKSFGGKKLYNILRDRWGTQAGANLPVKVHLFELLPGAKLGHIAKHENRLPGLGTYGKAATRHLHPLTSQAAGLLLGEPGLGCKKCVNKVCYKKRGKRGRHRFYYIEIPGAQARKYAKPQGKPEARKTADAQVKIDLVRNKIQYLLFLSEAEAQSYATKLRKNQGGRLHRILYDRVKEDLKEILLGKGEDHLKIVHKSIPTQRAIAALLKKIPASLKNGLKHLWMRGINKALIAFLGSQQQSFLQAVNQQADGVSLLIEINQQSGLDALRNAIEGKGNKAQISGKEQANASIKVKAGHFHAN